MQIIETAMSRSRTVLLSLAVVLVAGVIAYLTIPKEAEPDIEIPMIYVHITHDGISPEDGERLLVRPMEQELRTIEGIKEMTSTAGEGHASVQLEFTAGFDNKRALDDVRERVDVAKSKLPTSTDEPEVHLVVDRAGGAVYRKSLGDPAALLGDAVAHLLEALTPGGDLLRGCGRGHLVLVVKARLVALK